MSPFFYIKISYHNSHMTANHNSHMTANHNSHMTANNMAAYLKFHQLSDYNAKVCLKFPMAFVGLIVVSSVKFLVKLGQLFQEALAGI